MAEAEQQEKIPGLTEQWLLVDKDELDDHSDTSKQGTEEIDAKKIDQAPVSVEIAPTAREKGANPNPEGEITTVEEKQEVKENSPITKENSVAAEQNTEPSEEVEEKHEPVETTSTAVENNENPSSETEQVQEEENEEAKEETPLIKLETAPADFRFPTTNQTRHCFTRYIEFHRCINAKGEGAPECEKFAKYYRSLCPGEWIERWNEQRENGTFPGPL
ncbi:cytochrome c oxidase subunit 6b-1-like [Phalaenopsis equestris]|uniref:cytochrome c oxidase subunit 6b-1-like n=1 Tax=Phalaenopsis equestris TaxID=78828 RepID=UPI0009E49F61|nr:cytochrome c oxidase subunit 6b-1-like [Phalaenopsis equestris]